MVREHIPYPERHDLANGEKGFYPVQIPVSHWQLRHYISNPEQDLLYYASGHDVYCLNTATKKRKHITTLPFEARCTASGYGWVCVGGEDEGHFAAIKLNGDASRGMDVDSALPIEHWSQNLVRRAPRVKIERIGEEIVNSISIHRITDEEAHLDDIVAVLTNNDRTVRVYSLPMGQETRVKDLPFAMNHATISPDGTMMVAVGDYNQAYFFMRDIVDSPPQIPKPHNRLTSSSVEWTLTSVVTLHVSPSGLSTGYFTTAWSPNGQLVAVGSEGGYISVVDVEILTNPNIDDDDAVVAVVPGSRADRPTPHPGAIRSMAFSPEPWDLLIWAEDQGRVCIGDLRTGLKSRQVISLEPKDRGLAKLSFEDIPTDENAAPAMASLDDLETEWLRRYRSSDSQSQVNFATEYIEARRRQRQQRQEMASLRSQLRSGARQVPEGLSDQEQAILETLRTSRQREEARTNVGLPRSVNYTTPDTFNGNSSDNNNTTGARSSSISETNGADSARPISELLSSVQDSLPELSRTHATIERPRSSDGTENNALPSLDTLAGWGSSLRSGPNLARMNEPSRLPRRRQSILLSPPQSSSSRTQASSSTAAGAAETAETDDENPWRSESESRGPLFESAARARASSPLPAVADDLRDLRTLQAELHEQRRLVTVRSARDRLRREALQSGTVTLPSAARYLTVDGRYTVAEARALAGLSDGPAAANEASEGRANRSVAIMSTAEARLTRAEHETMMRRAQLRGYSGQEVGVRTAGLAVSADGRTLWAACEEGIFEVAIRLKGRLGWAALDMR